MTDVNLILILGAALLAGASPGPATLTIAGTAMQRGRTAGLAVAAGVSSGSLIWSVSAAFGLGAVMLANAWIFEGVRYFGAGYLMYLALRSARSALRPGNPELKVSAAGSLRAAYAKGLALHLTNPKAVLFFGSLYAIGIPPGTEPSALLTVIAAIAVQSTLIFHGYAILFSSTTASRVYIRLRRGFEALFAAAFGAASWQILMAKLS
ncbi:MULTISPECIES: LysE family translocator [unclassified Leisingera]|uniref:LysE family translocator n=1 Tax=unclassified Leisingera TaxID=2614906 RepID=UPI001010B1AA|nr:MULTISPECIES: LysE family translocator [unclassified Leisingera]MBQ4826517.1 LysE family translocator [Leisingera sp. HS039]MCF6429680.1 LysE family translocator [Leisingera sp. MMG026]QAX31382.1 LysE family translocator [Leisingera sp. NJS204]QBR38011.1 LysE family translocator [Leisingera sp. NJS201]